MPDNAKIGRSTGGWEEKGRITRANETAHEREVSFHIHRSGPTSFPRQGCHQSIAVANWHSRIRGDVTYSSVLQTRQWVNVFLGCIYIERTHLRLCWQKCSVYVYDTVHTEERSKYRKAIADVNAQYKLNPYLANPQHSVAALFPPWKFERKWIWHKPADLIMHCKFLVFSFGSPSGRYGQTTEREITSKTEYAVNETKTGRQTQSGKGVRRWLIKSCFIEWCFKYHWTGDQANYYDLKELFMKFIRKKLVKRCKMKQSEEDENWQGSVDYREQLDLMIRQWWGRYCCKNIFTEKSKVQIILFIRNMVWIGPADLGVVKIFGIVKLSVTNITLYLVLLILAPSS